MAPLTDSILVDELSTNASDLLKQIVAYETHSRDKAGLDELGRFLQAECQRLGAQLEIYPQTEAGDHFLARWPGTEPGILMLGHLDTVFPRGTLTSMPCYEQAGKIFGPGVSDMKGGIVIALTAMEQLIKSGGKPPRSLSILFTTDEEIGSRTSREVIERLARQSQVVFVLEPALPDGGLKIWRKGVGRFNVQAHGRAAHVANRRQGHSAILELARQIEVIEALNDAESGILVSVGKISGGSAVNVVPEHAWLEGDFRVTDQAQADALMRSLRALHPVDPGVTLDVHCGLGRPPMPCDARMQAAFETACQIAARIGMTLQGGGSSGGSDGNFVAALGIPVLDGLGAVGGNYHAVNEYILADSLAQRASLLAALLRDWPASLDPLSKPA